MPPVLVPCIALKTVLSTTIRETFAMQEANTPVEATISGATVLALPSAVAPFFVPSKGKTVLVAEKRGNWLVVDECQRCQYDALAEGKSIGEVLHRVPDSDKGSFMALLSQIFARDFFAEGAEQVSTPNTHDSAFMYLTYACNLQCSHCYMYKATNHEKPLSFDEYKKLFADLAMQGIKSVTFSGGEPLLNPLFRNLVLLAKDNHFNVTILSNGTKWDDDLISFASKFIDEVQISVDGIDDESCARVRGIGVFEKAVSTATALANSGVVTSIATTPVEATIHELEKGYLSFARRLQQQSDGKIIFRISSKLLSGRKCGASEEFAATAIKLANRLYLDDKCRSFAINHQPNSGLKTCGWGSLSFSPDGFAYPCNRIDDCSPLGSIRRDSIPELFKKAELLTVTSDVDHSEPCRKCPLRYLCGGGCRLDDFIMLSSHQGSKSIRRPCSEDKRMRILETMIETTAYLYSFEG